MENILKMLVVNYEGNAVVLSHAFGAFAFAKVFGWRVLRLTHTPATYSKYEKILGIKFKEECPDITQLGIEKSLAYQHAKNNSEFWKIVQCKDKTVKKSILINSTPHQNRSSISEN